MSRQWWTATTGWAADAAEPYGEPAVIDSWLLSDGAVRGFRLHEDRFARSCAATVPGLDAACVRTFLGAVRTALPGTGRWFPRVEAYPGDPPRLALWSRPAPEARAETVIHVPPRPDPRTAPAVKGPDLPALSELRVRAQARGADDALLYAADGSVVEAAHSALVWWRGDTLCLPAATLPVLPSVTCSLISAIAHERGVPVTRERARVPDLDGLEVWAVNALHGISPVVAFIGEHERAGTPGPAPRAAEWSAGLAAAGAGRDR